MLSLSPRLHDWWSRGLFGFFCRGITLGKESATVHLQFRWMTRKAPRNAQPKPEKPIGDEDDELKEFVNWHSVSNCPYDNTIAPVNMKSFREVQSGDHIDVKRTHDEARKMKIMIDFQWALISILTLSGAAGAPELLNRPGDFNSPGPNPSMISFKWLPLQ